MIAGDANPSRDARFRSADAERVYRANAVRIPIVRAIGFATLAAAVALHNEYVLDNFSARSFALLALALSIYASGSWIILHLYYRKERSDKAPNLAWLFHLGDLIGCILAVYASGGERSWLFFFLLVPVWNQTHFGAMRSIISGIAASTLYLSMILSIHYFGDRSVSIRLAAVQATLILLVTLYCAFAAFITERARKRVVTALREARGSAEHRANQLTSLNRLTQTVNSAGDFGPGLDSVAQEMVRLFETTNCAITMRDDHRHCLRVLAFHSRMPDAPDIRGFEIPYLSNPSCNYAIESRKPIVVSQAQTNPLTIAVHEPLRALGVNCIMVVPLVVHGDVIGTISIQSTDETRVFTPEEMELAETAAGQVAPIIRNAQRFDEEKRLRQLAERLQAAARVVSGSLELDEVLRRILEQLQEVIAFDAASVHLLEGDAMRVIAVRGHAPAEVGRIRKLSESHFHERLASSPEPVIDDGLPASEPANRREHVDSTRTALGVPMVLNETIIGALTLESATSRAYEPRDAGAAMSFARFAAIAVQHARLFASLQNEEQALRDAKQELEISNGLLVELSHRDGLTGVANRRHFDETSSMEWRRAVRSGAPLSLMMIDVDDFKAYNDHYGHAGGDAVLRNVAGVLREALLRAGDFVARYGGEEFVVLLPGTELADARQHAERLRSRVERLGVAHARARAASVVTISVGVATTHCSESGDPSLLIIAADQQLYEAKRTGRNRVSATYVTAPPTRSEEALVGSA